MKLDPNLNRLFQAAARLNEPTPPLSYRMESQVLAAWRDGSSPSRQIGLEETFFWKPALACAALIALLCVIPSLTQKTDPLAESIRVADQSLPWETSR